MAHTRTLEKTSQTARTKFSKSKDTTVPITPACGHNGLHGSQRSPWHCTDPWRSVVPSEQVPTSPTIKTTPRNMTRLRTVSPPPAALDPGQLYVVQRLSSNNSYRYIDTSTLQHRQVTWHLSSPTKFATYDNDASFDRTTSPSTRSRHQTLGMLRSVPHSIWNRQDWSPCRPEGLAHLQHTAMSASFARTL
jgi:hypothetical protein